jgi:hypothetical protein
LEFRGQEGEKSLKGLALSKIIYDDFYLRSFSDIDLLLEEKDIEKMYYLLHDIGYEQYAGYDKIFASAHGPFGAGRKN